MNRAQKRAASKGIPAYRRGATGEDLLRQMARNGITVQQYDKARKEERDAGFSEGVKAGREETIKIAYAAICLAAREKFGFGQKRCLDLLTAVDEQITYHLHSSDAIDDVLTQMGLLIDFQDPINTVKAVC